MIFRHLAVLSVFLAVAMTLGGLVWAVTDTACVAPLIYSDWPDTDENCPFQTLTFTARIVDDGQVVSATVWYQADQSLQDEAFALKPPPVYQSLTMADDGEHGDGGVGDQVYGAILKLITPTTGIGYYLSAVDDEGCERLDPPSAPNPSYSVVCLPPWPKVNEFMAINKTTLEDPDDPGEFPSWIELYSQDPDPRSIGGFYLTDDLGEPTKFRITDGITVSAGYLPIFWADGEPEQGPFHTNFVLNPEGGEIGIFREDGAGPISVVTYTAQMTDVSFARVPDGWGDWDFTVCPSPGMLNRCRFYLPLVARK
jgi:hypothetical protein